MHARLPELVRDRTGCVPALGKDRVIRAASGLYVPTSAHLADCLGEYRYRPAKARIEIIRAAISCQFVHQHQRAARKVTVAHGIAR